MIRQVQRMLRNPAQLLGYAIRNPKKIAAAVLVVVALLALVVLSFQMGLIPPWVVAFALVPLLAWFGHRQWERVRLLVEASEVDTGSVNSGLVKLTGTAAAAVEDDRVTSKMTDTECLAYRYKKRIDRDPGDNDALDGSVSRQTTERAVPFYVEDDTGEVLVDTNNADIELSWDEKSRGTRRDVFEAHLQEGDQVKVYGTAMAPSQREPPGVMDAVSDTYDTMAGRDFEAYANGEDVIVSKDGDDPYLIVSDRPGWRLLARHILVLLAIAALTVVALAVGILQAVGILSV
jgi:hypothetical protein